MTSSTRKPPPKPWPMKWIAITILIFVVGYTVVNVTLRKPGRAYRPYQDSQDRATTTRLLNAGWQKIHIDTLRPVEKPTTANPASISRAAVGLGLDLEPNFAERPKLLATIDKVVAPNTVNHGQNYTGYFTASLTDLKFQVSEVTLFRKGQTLVLVPTTETLPGKDLMSRWNDSTYFVSIPTNNLPPGKYDVRIVAKGPAAAWSFTVK